MGILNEITFFTALALLDNIASIDKEGIKKAVEKVSEEENTDIKCELAKLKKERAEKEMQLDELAGEIAAINVMISRFESLDKKISN